MRGEGRQATKDAAFRAMIRGERRSFNEAWPVDGFVYRFVKRVVVC